MSNARCSKTLFKVVVVVECCADLEIEINYNLFY